MSDRSSRDRDGESSMHIRLLEEMRSTDLAVGAPLPGELNLAERLKVARPQVREGLRVLEAFGVVDARKGARRTWLGVDGGAWGEQLGAILGSGSIRALEEFLEIRQTLEVALLPQAVSCLSEADLARVHQVALNMVELAEQGEDFSTLDEEFHRGLFEGLGNSMLLGLMSAYWRIFHSCTDAYPANEDRPSLARQHLTIIQAITAGDIRLGIHELDAHYYGVKGRIQALRTEAR
jgi:GntR family transcriptional regulator, transcriptional repressor for pyruvate dehydrogenase complex